MRKLNCWEFTKCGRQAEGSSEDVCGLCPSSGDIRLDGIHDGISAGRSCWVVAGTYAKGEPCCSLLRDIKTCDDCEFYQLVKSEEGDGFLDVATLREILGS